MTAPRALSHTLLAGLLLGLAACASQEAQQKLFIQNQHDSDVDFGAYRTYAWVPDAAAWANPVFLENPDLPGMIAAAVDRELSDKGFELASVGRANFLVAMSASVQDVTVLSKQRYPGWSHGYSRSSFGGVATATQMQKMAEGTLILEVIDVASEGVVWQSNAAGVITRRDGMTRAVNAAVTRMLEGFPPKS